MAVSAQFCCAQAPTILPTPPAQSQGARGQVQIVLAQPRETQSLPVQQPDTRLALEPFVAEVLARNPNVEIALANWRATAARYPQVTSLDDPMLDTMMAPASLGSNAVAGSAYVIQGRQKIPWSGKRQLRGSIVHHETHAAMHEVQDARLELTQLAKQAYYEYFVTARLQELNDLNRQALKQFHQTALQRYQANLVSQQDVLLADVELAELERRELALKRMMQVAVARINTLLLLPPVGPVPPPPTDVPRTEPLPDAEQVQQIALARRPDILAAFDRLRAEQAAVALANREYKPDLELYGRYDTFWLPQNRLVGQVGVSMNVPLARARREGAVREASAKVWQRRAEADQLVARVQFEVKEALAKAQESHNVVNIYERRILPAATESVRSAGAGYQAGNIDFLRLLQSQRELIDVRQRQVEALSEYHSRLADLERATGGPLPLQGIPAESIPAGSSQ